MQTWGMDGTFKVVPQWYQQLFTIHAFVAGKLVPAVYCLCTGFFVTKLPRQFRVRLAVVRPANQVSLGLRVRL
ncbi:hypothetical protein T03_672 [Trichinella britovi]|uniref:Uncharacterized protein n=1 Tax=Trichinella britovi TaxID=45882 RepID=A0A0V1BK27_TRIBR|nr:hypothetical protein T03_672 [Trichinella britovi]